MIPQFIIAGTGSGSGKTTLTVGILRALVKRGLKTVSFKCGPDFIDPMFHRQASGMEAYNLDGWFGNWDNYARHLDGRDAAVTEGVMGLFDGRRAGSLEGSTAECAARLQLPVLLTVNARGMSESIAPLVKGFAQWRSDVEVIGVLANQVGSDNHAKLLAEALANASLPPLLGYLKRDDRWRIPERHLGLTPGHLEESWLTDLARSVEATVQLDRILELAVRPCLRISRRTEQPWPIRLGVACDDAFCFYYQELFEQLRDCGGETVFFSPLHDHALPEHLDALYLGGGFPELYAEVLSQNHAMLADIRRFADAHPVYGECGGYLYLLESLADFEGHVWPLLGLLPGQARMNPRLAALGYREANGPFGTARGHEFHYSTVEGTAADAPLWTARDSRGRAAVCGACRANVRGSYVHLGPAPSNWAVFRRLLSP